MSYCRWSECDVYAYDSCEGGVRFWVAGDDSLNRLCGTYNEAYQYAKELRDKHGLDVPSYAIDALREDAIDEAKRYSGPDSAVAELIPENAKLRNEVELTKRMYAKVSEELCAEQADNERLRQELAIREESEQEKCIEYLRQENIDWEDKYRALANENAKLRELVSLVAFMERHPSEFWEQFDPYGFWKSWLDKASELGVEADA